MKLSKSAYNDFQRQATPNAILPLIDDDVVTEDHTKTSTFKLRTNPADANSPKYTLTVPIIDETATVRQVLKWTMAVGKVTTGLNIADGANKHPIIQELCTGSRLVAYNAGVNGNVVTRWLALQNAAELAEPAQQAGEGNDVYTARLLNARNAIQRPAINNADIQNGLNNLVRESCPYKALEKQKRFMRRKMRKPPTMTTRTYVANLIRINDEELPMLPPFGANQSLTVDELVDIVTFGVPKSWTRKMDEHAFDPIAEGLAELINFCERMEAADDFDSHQDTKPAAKTSSKKHKSIRNNGGKHKRWCHYHEVDTHDTSECETLKRLKKNQGSSDSKPAYKNKTWKRKSDDAKSYSKKELAAIAKKASKEAVKKATAECNAVAKRKSDSDSESDSSDDDASINMMETKMAAVDAQLAEFNFDDAKSDGEISC